jgi:8-oxo-dGTP pyrophosphatase MutT (NUDIX family)
MLMEPKMIVNKLKAHTPTILGSENFSKYAVLLPLIQSDNEIHILFEVRSQKMRRQPGEICFPGGRIDQEDKDPKSAALRETKEELGVKCSNISNVFPLDYLVSPFGMIVYPYVGFIDSTECIKPNSEEVGETFLVPLSFFLTTSPRIHHVNVNVEPEENFPYELIVGGQNYNWRTRKHDEYFYIYDEKVIWGLTAKILYHFIQLME